MIGLLLALLFELGDMREFYRVKYAMDHRGNGVTYLERVEWHELDYAGPCYMRDYYGGWAYFNVIGQVRGTFVEISLTEFRASPHFAYHRIIDFDEPGELPGVPNVLLSRYPYSTP